jgi:type I restriction-modification system DNA methylase subunit
MRLSNEVTEVLKTVTVDGSIVRMPTLEKKLYLSVNDALNKLGGVWKKNLKGHLFPENPWNAIAEAVETGSVVDLKKEFQFFETPNDIAADMVQLLCVEERNTVLEPSAGHGRLIKAVMQHCPRSVVIDYCELRDQGQAILARDFPMAQFQCGDFLKLPTKQKYDRVIANPPFRNGQDIAHIYKMYEHLKPGGRLVSIAMPSWVYRTDSKYAEFRMWLEDRDHEVEELGAGAFSESGTEINTVRLVIRKA